MGFNYLKVRDRVELPGETHRRFKETPTTGVFILLCRSTHGTETAIPPKFDGKVATFWLVSGGCGAGTTECRPRFKTGQKLAVMEPWARDSKGNLIFRLDGAQTPPGIRWNRANTLKPGDARHAVEVTNVALKRLLDLGDLEIHGMGFPSREAFHAHWNKSLSYWMVNHCEAERNPWIWVYEFKGV